ncbi:MAG: sugar ABC transporter ATP-binding protein [Clostridia bacterium]
MQNITKDYSGVVVLENVNLAVKSGEIHALLGENGAGKSTLMNILFGMSVIHETGGFSGEILFEGEKTAIKSPQDAMNLGIGMVHQEFMLIPGFTVTENIKLNREISRPNAISKILGKQFETLNFIQMNKDARKALDTLDIGIEEYVQVAGLPVGYMQFVEIAREIDKENIKVLVFDEPTAVLAESEAENLLKAMQILADKGIAILFITHRLDEVMNIADTVTILKDGKLVDNVKTKDTTIADIAEKMVGRKIERLVRDTKDPTNNPVILSLENFYVEMPGEVVKGVDLEVHEGEIYGIGGLGGQGKIGIANGIMGLYPARGKAIFNGEELKLNDPCDALNKGFAFVSEDRRGIGLLLDTSIEMNIVTTAINVFDKYLKKWAFISQIDQKLIRSHADKMIEELDIRCQGPTQHTRRLSGGNQQKVCIARALTLDPKVILVSEPTRGIDVGAKRLVLDTLTRLNQEQGLTVIITSSELAELRSICNRIAIINKGQVAGIVPPDASDVEFGLLMAGEKKEAEKIG